MDSPKACPGIEFLSREFSGPDHQPMILDLPAGAKAFSGPWDL